jgi:hypothetical protein
MSLRLRRETVNTDESYVPARHDSDFAFDFDPRNA